MIYSMSFQPLCVRNLASYDAGVFGSERMVSSPSWRELKVEFRRSSLLTKRAKLPSGVLAVLSISQ